MSSLQTISLLLLVVPILLCACEEGPSPLPAIPPSNQDAPPPIDIVPQTCSPDQAFDPGRTPPRRLTELEYRNTVRDLLGMTLDESIHFPPEEQALGFDNNASALQVTALHVERFMESAESLAKHAVSDLETMVVCTENEIPEECAGRFIAHFGSRAWRRPLEDPERDALMSVYLSAKMNGVDVHRGGIELVIQAVLQSPSFLYRIEVGTPSEEYDGLRQLTQYELASRLSYFLWRSMPDDALFLAAAEGELTTVEQIGAQVDRMLMEEKARDAFWTFFTQWLHLKDIKGLVRDARYYPGFGPNEAEEMEAQARGFVEDTIWSGGGSMAELFRRPFELEDDPAAVRRLGILSLPAILAATSKPNMTSPIHRGIFVREQILCTPLPPPPPDAMVVAPDPDPNLTTRQLFEVHTAEPACAGCHGLIDSIGLGFEHFDAIGDWRDEQNGRPIDAQGNLIATTDINGPFYGVDELSEIISGSDQVHRCVATQVFRYAIGRGEGANDGCTLESIYKQYVDSHYDFRVLIRALVTNQAFRHRSQGGE